MNISSNFILFCMLALAHQADAYYTTRRRSKGSIIAGIVVAVVALILLLLLMFVINRRRRRRFDSAILQPAPTAGNQGPTFMTGGSHGAYTPPPPGIGSPYGGPTNQLSGYPNYHTEKPAEPQATYSPPPGVPPHLQNHQMQSAPQNSFQAPVGSPPGYDTANPGAPQPPAPAHAKEGHDGFVGGFRP
ncbi:hypothetical protein DL96DRAFT_1814328 [Flagelloscypha sp. PMI_526]|nr:hypothetical protein DL96DRAFT_1814328 [Flagelloscypha sp. PMI_526]